MSEKKIAVVTGGARGIGKAIALELAKAGNLVVINYNGSEEKARDKSRDRGSRRPGRYPAVQCGRF